MLLTLSAYAPGRTMPWHCHENPTLFLLLAGNHRDLSASESYHQTAFGLVYHPTTSLHAGEFGLRPALGLNIEYGRSWLAEYELDETDLGAHRPLDSAEMRWAALQFLVTALRSADECGAEVDTRALELLAPFVKASGRRLSERAPTWLRRAEEYLAARFREPVSLRDVAREAKVHPVYLARVFRRRHRRTVSEYLRAERLMEATRLALQGATLAEAALAAGFADQAHFRALSLQNSVPLRAMV